MIPFSKKHDQWVLREMHNRGIEMTPDELMATRKSGFRKLRESLREKGLDVPDDDVGLLAMLQESARRIRRNFL